MYWPPPAILEIGRNMAQQGFILAVVTGVGGFLGSRLMGLYETPPEASEAGLFGFRMRRFRTYLILGILLFISFWMEGFFAKGWGYALRALVVTIGFSQTRC